MNQNSKIVRERSWQFVTRQGLGRNESLPPLESHRIAVTAERAASRLLSMHAIAAVVFGFPASAAKQWLLREGIISSLSSDEAKYLAGDERKAAVVRLQVASAYSLAWCAGITESFEFMKQLPDDFVLAFPDLENEEPTDAFRNKVRLRDVAELLPVADLAYCLHWALRDAQLKMKPTKELKWLLTVEANRHSFEWIFAGCHWDEVVLDT